MSRSSFRPFWALLILGGCASNILYASYTFHFDVSKDGQNVYVLDYKYKAGDKILISASNDYVKLGTRFVRDMRYAPMPPGTSLYVKWVDNKTGETYEETADFGWKLSGNITGDTVYFMILDDKLHVYLITDEIRRPGDSVVGPKIAGNHKVIELYPQ